MAGAWWTRMREPAGLTLVADVRGRCAGFVCAMTPSRDDDATAQTAEIAALHVEPEHRRTGIGGVLMAAMTGAMRDRGFAAATLWVRADNVPAQELYAKLGWRPDGGRKSGGGGDQVRLRRRT